MSRSRDVDAACEVADPATIARAAAGLNCRSVAFTYNDPIVFAEYAIDSALACHQAGIKTVAVTSGYINPVARDTFFRHMDAANIDLKAFSEHFYRELTGGHLEPVLDTLRWLVHQSDTWVEITNLVIPQANDSPEELKQMCQWICDELGPDVPIHFSAFHPDFKFTDRGPTPLKTLLAAHDIARGAGLRYVYTGNISDQEHQGTYCPECGRVVIQRDGYTLGVYNVREGCCRHCRTPIAGRFDPEPGTWGGRRLPVRIASYAPAKTSNTISKEETKVANIPAKQPNPPQDSSVRPELTEEQEQLILRAAGRRVAAVVTGQKPEPIEAVLAEAAGTPLYGAFVSLKRSGQLRSCCGFMGQPIRLAEAVDRAADRAAKDDPRFPPISPTELNHLDIEVWLLWGLQPVTARGEDRISAVTIGKHGLQISRGSTSGNWARGLLLPGVAVEHNLDAKGFLKQVCLKAGLPPDAWRQDETTLMTFEGHAIQGRLCLESDEEEKPSSGPTPAEVAALADFCRRNISAMLQRATPSYYMPGGYDGPVSGLAITVGQPGSSETIECSKFSVRPELPLQSTLFSLIQVAAGALQARRIDARTIQTIPLGLTVLLDPAMQGTVAEPELQGVDPKRRVVLVSDSSRSAWVFDPQLSAEELLTEAVQQAGFTDAARANVLSMAVVSTEQRVSIANVPRPQQGPEVRPAAVAGMFYPAMSEEIDHALDEMLPRKTEPQSWPAVMVPHAGWKYSGRLATEVFSRVKIPEQVIVLCPKHRAGGTDWAVAPHRTWSLPGREVESDPELARQLAEAITDLELDAVAHRQEHAVEVHLPLIARLAPHARVVGITIGGGELTGLQRFGQQMAEVLRNSRPRPLLVISSDMNHFADQPETRRLDRLALDAMESLDPKRLYETVRENRISMCGMAPAVIVMETLRQWDCLSRCESVGYTTSAEASGETNRVVGYAGMLLG
jgi:AmmeMemoRadiSam system radical SAM enzyme/AmmeMemoRadiSam system protein B/AmmeMemoRadiSam system protein A